MELSRSISRLAASAIIISPLCAVGLLDTVAVMPPPLKLSRVVQRDRHNDEEQPVFHREYFGKPQELTDRERLIRSLAEEYHKRCDDYDNQTCTGVNHKGEKIPETTYQYADIVNNARKVRQELEGRAIQNGITLGELSGAIQLQRIYAKSH